MDVENIESAKINLINVGKKLYTDLDLLKNVQGVAKIQKKILSEVSTLEKKQITIHHILCSNLIHYEHFVKILKETKDIHCVDFPIKRRGDRKASVRVDIVANDGCTWIKVIARNPKALNDIAFGRSNYGAKSILDHAKCYIEAAKDNQYFFKSPEVIFDFANEIDEELERSLEQINISVRINGRRKEYNVETTDSVVFMNKLNLDVTTMMAFVSNLTCETCDCSFKEPILKEQAQREKIAPTKRFLDQTFDGKELIACETATNSFLDILSTVGGRNETLRASQLLKMITVLPDLSENEENTYWSDHKLKMGKKITKRTFKIITFGMFHKAITVTANKGAVEAAKKQGIFIPAVIHEARALTEQKQIEQEIVLNEQ